MDIISAKMVFNKKYTSEENQSFRYIEEYEKDIIHHYNELSERLNLDFLLDSDKKEIKKKQFDEKKCICGGNIRFINVSGGGFYGCNDYKKERFVHFTCNDNYNFDPYVSVNIDYCTDIIKKCGLKGKINAKELDKWFNEKGFENLREKYGLSRKWYDCLPETKKVSRIEEKRVEVVLRAMYDKVLPQQILDYRCEEYSEMLIPDFICSNKDKVIILDHKLHGKDANFEKLDLYESVMRFIMKNNKDERKLSSKFIFSNMECIGEFYLKSLEGRYIIL